jgi:hypothetical protein
MKIIDLINMRAEGKEMPKKIRIDHWCYNFEWVKHISNYYDENNDIDLMSCLSMDKEELNYEVEIIEEDKKIEKIDNAYYHKTQPEQNQIFQRKINEIIDKVNSLENKQ